MSLTIRQLLHGAVGVALIATVEPASAQVLGKAASHSVQSSSRAGVNPSEIPYSTFSLGADLGAYVPSGDEASTFKSAPGFGFTAGLRFDRNLQLDAGFGIAVGAAGIHRNINTTIGSRGTSDYEGAFLLGGRYIWPSADETVLFSLGAGWAFGFYEEDAGDVSNETIYCTSCAPPTSGQGAYGLAELEFMVNSDRSAGVSLFVRGVDLKMNDYFPAGSRPQSSTGPTDSWATIGAKLTFHF